MTKLTARQLRLLLIGGALALIAVVGVSFVVSELGTSSEPTTRNERIGEVGHPIFWLGEHFAGEPLDRVIEPLEDDWSPIHFVLYGSCGESFERGCDPAFTVKTSPRCDPELREDLVIRGRTVRREEGMRSVETGAGAVYVYGPDSALDDAVASLSVMNASSIELAPVEGDDLPGSHCALFRTSPRQVPIPSTPDSYTPDPHAATVFSAFESISSVERVNTYADAMDTLGARILRTHDARYSLSHGSGIGAFRTLRNPLPFLEQRYDTVNKENPIHIRQEPESYGYELSGDKATIGQWEGDLSQSGDQVWFAFWSGEETRGQRIRVVVWGPGYELDEVELFISTLTFD